MTNCFKMIVHLCQGWYYVTTAKWAFSKNIVTSLYHAISVHHYSQTISAPWNPWRNADSGSMTARRSRLDFTSRCPAHTIPQFTIFASPTTGSASAHCTINYQMCAVLSRSIPSPAKSLSECIDHPGDSLQKKFTLRFTISHLTCTQFPKSGSALFLCGRTLHNLITLSDLLSFLRLLLPPRIPWVNVDSHAHAC